MVHFAGTMKRDDLLDLNEVLQHPGRRIELDVSTELPDEADVDLVAPLDGTLDAVSTGNLLLLTGKFRTRAVLECARCVNPIELDLEFELDEQFAVEGTPSSYSQQDYARVKADEPFPLFDGNHLLVENLLRQGLLLAMPVQPLCAAGWDGPCAVADAAGLPPVNAASGRPEFAALLNLLSERGSSEPATEGPASELAP